jgi:hypothetical protein
VHIDNPQDPRRLGHLGIQRAQLEHAIAILLGKPASSFSIATNSLAIKPVAIPFGVPSQLLERRPDVAVAERRVAEANAQISVARGLFSDDHLGRLGGIPKFIAGRSNVGAKPYLGRGCVAGANPF